ncbi:MAG: hypothetical protein KBE04_07250 [Phycisphaerae bacterium]|nr:hypothetical protein [Phycisphaerae bacterium]
MVPVKAGYAFEPSTRRYIQVGRDLADQDYVAKEIVYTISGSTGQSDVVLEGLQTLDAGQVLSDGKGNYSVKVRHGWNGTVTPVKEGFVFTPANKTYTGVTRNYEKESYKAMVMTFEVSGSITAEGNPVAGVVLQGLPGRPTTTSNAGTYSVKLPYGWSGVMRPLKEGYDFDPPERSFESVTEALGGQDYSAMRKMCTLTGSIGIPGVTVTADNNGGSDQTGADGRYAVKVPYGWSGHLIFAKEGYEFDPADKFYEKVTTNIDEDIHKIGYLRQDRAHSLQPGGMEGSSPRIRIVPTSKADPEAFTAIADDLQVMLHILRKNLTRKPAGMSGVFPDYGDLLVRDQERLEGLYIQGYGAILFTEVDLARSAPLEKKADQGQAGATPVDPVWDQARQEMDSGGDPFARINPKPGPADRALDQGWGPEDLVKELIQTFRHASNIRHLDPNETLTLSVIGRIPVPLLGDLGITGDIRMRQQPNPVRGLKETIFTLQARKSDIDQFARSQLTPDQFRQKVKVLTY